MFFQKLTIWKYRYC